MGIIAKTFGGKMNLDDNQYRIAEGDYIMAENITRDAQGAGQDVVVSNIMGNTLFGYNLPLGQNKVIGQYPDRIRNRIYYHVWNSNDFDLMLFYDKTNDILVKMIENITDTGGEDVLQFDPSFHINHINIIYREEGDLYYWVDAKNNPRKMNVLKILAGTYGTIEDYIISVIVIPPNTPPVVAYANDASININNIRKNLFEFAERYVYDDFEKSVLSSFSKLPLPVGILDTNTEADPTKNNYITVTVQTGHKNVAKLQILGRYSLGDTYSDWFLITTLDKAVLGINNDTTYTFNFYNDSAYVNIDPVEAVLLYDYVPDIANAQELPNGNYLAYGGITEGLDRITLDVGVTVTSIAADISKPHDSIPYYGWNSRYSFGLQYFTKEGKTNGVITEAAMNIRTPEYSITLGTPYIASIQLSINNRPPDWAYYYQVVRTNNLSMATSLDWVSNVTDKDSKYAYIGISNIDEFIAQQPVTAGVLGYTFKDGDRIQFLQVIGASTALSGKDYAIVGVVPNPAVNGTIYHGNFVKIQLPTTSGTFDFGGEAWAQYLINLYTPTKPVGTNLNTFYEFGERYAIGDPTLSTRYHFGKSQNQTPNLSQPAIITLTEGDMYFRPRTVPVGLIAKFVENTASNGDGAATIGFSYVSQTYPKTEYTFGSSPNQDLAGFVLATNTTRQIITINTPASYFFRIQGVFKFTVPIDSTFNLYLQANSGAIWDLIPNQTFTATSEHDFNVDVTIGVSAAAARIFIFQASSSGGSGAKTYIASDFTITDVTENLTPYILDFNFVDTYASAVNSNGRPTVIDENIKRDYFPTLMRYSGAYQQDTNINNTNRFYPEAQDTYDRLFADITKFFINHRYLYVFQKFNTGVVPILTQVVRDTAGNPLEANSEILLNKITYPYAGQYGLIPESFAFAKGAMYGADIYKGVVWRLSQDGMIPLSILYKTNAFFVGTLNSYRTDLNTGYPSPDEPTYTGNPSVYGMFNGYTNKYIIALEEINRYDVDGGLIFHQDPYTLCFNETRDASEGFESFYTFYPEMMCFLDNLMVTFKNGQMWKHQPYTYLNFYGENFDASITSVFLTPALEKKTFLAIMQEASQVWDCPEISTSVDSYPGTKQSSYLIVQQFVTLEGAYQAALLRDTNSIKGLYNGDSLKGVYMIAKFRLQNTPTFQYLNVVSLKFIESQLNTR